MRLKNRIDRLASQIAAEIPLPVTDADWVAAFEQCEAAGWLAGEPDLPRALAAFRAAVAANPGSPPPPGFEPAGAAWDRYERWRGLHPRLAVDAGREWLAELVLRAIDGVPPVGEVEFAELAGWVRENEGWLAGLADTDGLVGIGSGMGCRWRIWWPGGGRGPRVPGGRGGGRGGSPPEGPVPACPDARGRRGAPMIAGSAVLTLVNNEILTKTDFLT